jgi:hypothetical protein
MTTVLFLTADPSDASRLRLGEEIREVQEKLSLAKLRDRFILQQRMSIRPPDISQALLDINPEIVHFSGHGTFDGALCIENKYGKLLPVKPEALAALFEQFTGSVNCVIINACFSIKQAEAISKHIQYVIGMNEAINDRAAISFSVGFYQALGAGRSIEEAYNLGCVQIQLENIPEHLKPVLIKNNDIPKEPDPVSEIASQHIKFAKKVLALMPLEFSSCDLLKTLENFSDNPYEPSTKRFNEHLFHIMKINGLIERIGGSDSDPHYQKI